MSVLPPTSEPPVAVNVAVMSTDCPGNAVPAATVADPVNVGAVTVTVAALLFHDSVGVHDGAITPTFTVYVPVVAGAVQLYVNARVFPEPIVWPDHVRCPTCVVPAAFHTSTSMLALSYDPPLLVTYV